MGSNAYSEAGLNFCSKAAQNVHIVTTSAGGVAAIDGLKVDLQDTTGIEPLAHPVAAFQDVALRLRADTASEPDQREANQRSAPAVEAGLFLVPKVIE